MSSLKRDLKILNISLPDKAIFDVHSKTAYRLREYGEIVEKYTVVLPAKKNQIIQLSGHVAVYGSGGRNKISQLINCYKIADGILNQGYDLITVHGQYFLSLLGLILAKKHNIGMEMQIHGWEKYSLIRSLVARFNISRANAFRVVGKRLKEQLINKYGVESEKITVASIFVDITRPEQARQNSPWREAFQDSPKRFIFLTVGRLAAVKNIGLQIRAMVEVVKKYPEAELWIVGDGPGRRNCEQQIAEGQLEKNVKTLGWKNNLEEFYEMADAFVLTSNSEGWGLAIIEAASFGLPIIVTDVGCAGEVIIDNESGLVIPIGGIHELIEAMLKIITDENLRRKIGGNAKLAASRLPNKEQTLELYIKSWEQAIL